MKKLNKKVLFFLAIISFFVGINNVKAAASCEYVSPFAKISHDGTYTIGMNVSILDTFNNGNGVSLTGVKELEVKTGTDTDGIYIYNMSVNFLEAQSVCYKNCHKSKQEVHDISTLYFPVEYGPTLDSCPDYIRYKNENDGSNKYASATSAEYKNYIEHQQYASVSGKSVTLYTTVQTYSGDWVVIGNGGFYSILTENPVFVNKNLSYSFKANAKNNKTNLDILKEKVNEYGEAGTWSEIQPKLDSTILNTSDVDNRAHTNAYYEGTKDRVYNYIKSDMNKKTENINPAGKNNLKNWLYYCGRYLFEENDAGVKTFTKYYKFLYGDPSDLTKVGKTSEYTQEQYSSIVDALDAMVSIKNTSTKEESYNENKCNVFCPSCIKGSKNYNSTSCSTCTSGSSKSKDYEKCYSCVYGAKKCYSGLGESDMKNCLSNCMGEDTYNTYISKKTEFEESLNREYSNSVEKLAEAVNSVDLPSVKIGFSDYDPKCSDVSFLTDIWSLTTLFAPFLIIIFGSFDYFAAVVSSDVEKLKKAKSKFPRRLLAFVLFLVVPLLIKILLKTFGTRGSGRLTYFYCVLSGDKSDSSGSSKTSSSTGTNSGSNNSNSGSSSSNSSSSSGYKSSTVEQMIEKYKKLSEELDNKTNNNDSDNNKADNISTNTDNSVQGKI